MPNDDNFAVFHDLSIRFFSLSHGCNGGGDLISFAACGGKVIGEGGGDDSSTNKPDAGGGDSSTTQCQGDLNIPVCPVCVGDTNPNPPPQCIDGAWTCPATKCEPPPPDNCETTPAPGCGCSFAQCVNNQWACAADCGGNCPASVDNLGGAPCVTEGLICGDECGDPCQECNYVVCTGGTWNEVESTPVACDGG